RELQRAEKECCDGWVIDTLPGATRHYATALLDAVDFLAETSKAPMPLACSVGQFPVLKRRLQRILKGTAVGRLPSRARLVVLALAAFLLPLLPTLAKPTPTAPAEAPVFEGASDQTDPDEPLLFDDKPTSLQ